ncbi:glycosylphosphatidylinositol anchor biosynthesis [Microbotryomycetes sp. JL201]|nr:glycosylphosphatidylinositol anchor biosynthesis [Microbotryomycetes sp. JL201]
MQRLWLAVACWRVFNAVVSRSFFQPDEYWQSLEVAHEAVFSYGFKTWEWRSTPNSDAMRGLNAVLNGGRGGIRSAVHPMLFVPLLWSLKVLELDDTMLLVFIWLYLGCVSVAQSRARDRLLLIRDVIFIGIAALVLSTAVDTWFYGTLTVTPLRFLHENVFNSISLFYGANASHFYLSQGLPITLMTQLPFVVHGAWLAVSMRGSAARHLAGAACFTLSAYSLLSHKEWRFIHPLMPMFSVLASMSLVRLSSNTKSKSLRSRLPIRQTHLVALLAALIPAVYLTSFHGIAQVNVMSYLRSLPPHQLHSAAFLMPCHSTPWQSHLHRRDLEEPLFGGSGQGGRLWFITCEPPIFGQNATTYKDQSDVFYDSPSTYLVERFPQDVNPGFPPSPAILPGELIQLYERGQVPDWKHEWPSHIVLFQALVDEPVELGLLSRVWVDHEAQNKTLGNLLASKGYVEVKRSWNSLWHEDDRRRGDVIVLQWRP